MLSLGVLGLEMNMDKVQVLHPWSSTLGSLVPKLEVRVY